jgi:ACS family hexuronate transporter-like MFS transporter
VAINTMWQLLRAWLPKIMQEHYGYGERDTLLFNSAWYVVTDIGCLVVGAATLYLGVRGWSVKGSRLTAMLACVLMVATLLATPWLQGGPLLLAILLVSGAGALGMFPLYYSFSQDVSRDHLGKVVALATPLAWVVSSRAQRYFGQLADATGRFDIGLALVGLLPIVPLVALWLFWPQDSHAPTERTTS